MTDHLHLELKLADLSCFLCKRGDTIILQAKFRFYENGLQRKLHSKVHTKYNSNIASNPFKKLKK